MKKLIIILLLFTYSLGAQTVDTTRNNTQVITNIQMTNNANLIPSIPLLNNRVVPMQVTPLQPNFINQNFMERTTIVIERFPYFTQPLNVYRRLEQQDCDCKTQAKTERPFVPRYIHLNLNKQ